MFAPLPFALYASAGCPPAAELALSLASSFQEVDAELLDDLFASLSARVVLDGADRGDPMAELRAVAALCGECPALRVGGPMGFNALMLDHALLHSNADPLVVAIALVEIGRRAGIPLGIVSDGEEHCVAHPHLADPLVIRARDGEVVDARRCGVSGSLAWRCPHEVCALIIDALEFRWERAGHLSEALRAAELRLCLPLEEDAAARAAMRLEVLRARLN